MSQHDDNIAAFADEFADSVSEVDTLTPDMEDEKVSRASDSKNPQNVNKMKKGELIKLLLEAKAAGADLPGKRDLTRSKVADLRELYEALGLAQSSGDGDMNTDPEKKESPQGQVLESMADGLTQFNLLLAATIEAASQSLQPGGYVLHGMAQNLAEPQTYQATRDVMKEIAQEAADSVVVRTIASPWSRYALIMTTAARQAAYRIDGPLPSQQ